MNETTGCESDQTTTIEKSKFYKKPKINGIRLTFYIYIKSKLLRSQRRLRIAVGRSDPPQTQTSRKISVDVYVDEANLLGHNFINTFADKVTLIYNLPIVFTRM